MTTPPPPGAPFPRFGGQSLDPSKDITDPWLQTVRERMFEERVVFVSGELDDAAANSAAMELMTLDANGDSAVRLQIDCNGGTLDAAFALMDVIDALGIDVHATCVGGVSGPAVGVVAVSHRRVATPHARFRLTEPNLEVRGRPRDIEAAVGQQRARLRSFCERLATATGRSADSVADDLRRGRFLGAEEAKGYGLIDEVSRAEAQVLKFPRQLGFRRT